MCFRCWLSASPGQHPHSYIQFSVCIVSLQGPESNRDPDQVAPEPKDRKQGKQSAARPYQQNPASSAQVLSCCLLLLLIGRGEGWKTPIYSNKAWHQTSLSHGSLVRAQQVLGFKCCWVLLFYLLKLPEIFSSPLWLPLPLGRLQIVTSKVSVQIMKMWSKTLDLSPLLATSDRASVDMVDGWPGNWSFFKLGGVSKWEDLFACFAMIAVFVVRKMWSQWAVISICLFFHMSFCTHSSNLSCYCPTMVLQPAGISTKPATNLCMLWPYLTFNSLLSYMLDKTMLLEMTPSRLFRTFLIMSHQHHFLWVICHPEVIPRWTTLPLVFERRAFVLCVWDVLTRSIAF